VQQIQKRVLVVDDSAFMRRLITEIVEFREDFCVVGTACNGIEALQRIRALSPDIVTLDIAMPEMDGLAALERIMDEMPRPVIVVSAAGSSDINASAIRALELGAVEFVRKPSGPVSIDFLSAREQMLRALEMASMVRFSSRSTARRVTPAPRLALPRLASPASAVRPTDRVVVIAASTGGPRALSEVISRLPSTLDAAVLILQHMPSEFIPVLADRLGQLGPLQVAVAVDGESILAGRIYLAPGAGQMRVRRRRGGVTIEIVAGDPVSGLRPSADQLFRSAAKVFGSGVIGVVLSGMGRDGAEGLRAVRGAGGRAIVQDRASSIIYGMPGAALATAGADSVVAASRVAGAITALLGDDRRVA
jgi:two-component system chemotaxis response regulator CheB